ncbi:MAG: pentapeptide repeat-containing protein, partial [Nitrospinota bacterium]|nr:pentapeptide repeat-containing protein [Nitrospinota bacterium]
RAILERANLKGANLVGAMLREANLLGALLDQVILKGASLQGANLRGARIMEANLQEANLREAILQGANLEGANLEGAMLIKANLEGAILAGTNLEGSILLEANLHGANLHIADLFMASLQNADLRAAEFQNANLIRANFQGANLEDANLQDATVSYASFRNADLRRAKLEKSINLQAIQLGGADVSNAQLPEEIQKFQAVGIVEETSKNARTIFLSILAACVYSWLTLATTTDADLILGSSSLQLPVVQANVPVIGFFIAAPILLLSLYIYLHLYLKHLWESLATLPAVFPDGRTIDKVVYPWLLNSLVLLSFKRLKGNPPQFIWSFSKFRSFLVEYIKYFFSEDPRSPLWTLQVILSIVTAWMVVPITLGYFWFRYLTRHDEVFSLAHSGFIAIAVGFGYLIFYIAIMTLRNAGGEKVVIWRIRSFGAPFSIIVSAFITMLFCGFSHYIINHESALSPWFSANLAWSDLSQANLRGANLNDANLLGAQLSKREKDKTLESQMDYYRWVIGADLAGMNLRRANLEGAFLARADLSFADLQGANLASADLFGVNFRCADLRKANFKPYRVHKLIKKPDDPEPQWVDQPDLSGAIIDETTIARFRDRKMVEETLARKDEILKECAEERSKGATSLRPLPKNVKRTVVGTRPAKPE